MLVVFFEFKQMLKAVPPIHFAIKILELKQCEPYRLHKTRRKDLCYEQYKLFEAGSWLFKPVKTVMDLMNHFDGQNNFKYLTLALGEIAFQLQK